MTRARELANFADDTAGLETLTVSDITDLTATATEINKIDGFTGDHNDLIYAKDLRATGVTTTEFDKLDGLTASASDINSTVNQITDSSTDLNVDSNTLVVDKSANAVGIGVTAPSTQLEIQGATPVITLDTTSNDPGIQWSRSGTVGYQMKLNNSNKLYFYNNSTKMTLDSSGNVGIGATAPAEKLHIQGTGNSQLTIRGDEGEDAGFSLVADEGDDNADWWKTYIDHSDSSKLKIANYSTGSWSDKFIIDSSGKVGIGLTGPNAKLHVRESGLFTNAGTDAGYSYAPTTPILTVTTDGNGSPSTTYQNNAVFKVGIGGGDAGTVTTEYFRVNLNGNIGIAYSSPAHKLDVNGSCRIQGEFHQMSAASSFHERKSGQGGTVSTGGTTMFTVSKNDWNNKQAAIWQMLGSENNRNQMHRFGSLHANYHDGWSITTWASHDQGNSYGNSTVSVDGSGNVKMHAPIINNNGFMKLISGVGF